MYICMYIHTYMYAYVYIYMDMQIANCPLFKANRSLRNALHVGKHN